MTCTGRHQTLQPSRSLSVMGEIAGVNTRLWADLFIVRRKGQMGGRVSRWTQRSRVRPGEGWAPSVCTLLLSHHEMTTSNQTSFEKKGVGGGNARLMTQFAKWFGRQVWFHFLSVKIFCGVLMLVNKKWDKYRNRFQRLYGTPIPTLHGQKTWEDIFDFISVRWFHSATEMVASRENEGFPSLLSFRR